jgi:hypothetical protein
MNSLEQEIIDRAGKRMADEMDFTILTDMLCSIGWTRVLLKPMTHEHGQDIDAWVKANVKGHFETMGLVWVFEHSRDANWFALKWMS